MIGLTFRQTFLFILLCVVRLLATTNTAWAVSAKDTDLYRADFRIAGTSCADCLMTAERLLGKSTGVKRARVMLIPPYAASVIFNSRKTSLKKLVRKLEKRDFQIKELESREISKIPEDFKPEHSSLNNKSSQQD